MHVRQIRKDVAGQREGIQQSGTLIALLCERERRSNAGRLALEHLEQERFTVRIFSTGPEVLEQLEQFQPSLIFIETSMSRRSALEVCGGIRRTRSLARIPLILLAANASEEERVMGLEAGADDYITEPYSGREVIARVRAVMRRFARYDIQPMVTHEFPAFLPSATGILSPKIKAGDIEIDSTAMRISVRGSEVATTGLEFRLLYYLVHNQARVFSRDQLLDAVWGPQNVELRSVDACVRRLRRKIEPDPLRPTYLKTVRGAGYCWRVGTA
jgi:DNA-binding response OmpR family regulator